MKLALALDRTLYGPNGGTRYLWARIEAPRVSPSTPRAPLDIALVLDRSGSMAGEKIALAKRACQQAIDMLRETDRCALVAYDDEVTREAACASLGPDHRARLATALRVLDARRNTDLFGGWMAGANEVTEDDPARIRRVILLTDGLANVGVTDHPQILHHVRELAVRGVGTSTFGVGLDFDELLVSGMAEAGQGHFYYVEKPQQIPDYLSSELGELLTVAGRSVTLALVVSGGISVLNLNELPLMGAFYQLGDLTEGSVTDVCFALNVPAGVSGPLQVSVRMAWQSPDGAAPGEAQQAVLLSPASDEEVRAQAPDREALKYSVTTRAARLRSVAHRLNRSGAYEEARTAVLAEIARLEELAADVPEAAEEARALRESLERYSSPMSSAASKAMHMQAYSVRHNRPQR